MRVFPAALALLALSACTRTDTEALPRASAPDPATDPAAAQPASETRAEAAGLTPEQAADLERLAVPVYVPDLPDGWALIEQTAALQTDGASEWPEYTLRYRTPQSTCLALHAASEGLGDVFVQSPPHERDVRVPGVPTDWPVPLGWGIPGERTEGWEDGRVGTEWFGTDGLALRVASDDTDGCRPASPEAAETFAASLRPLDPADDPILIGRVATADEIYQSETGLPTGPDPEAVAREFVGPEEPGEGTAQTTFETLRRRDRFAVVLVTMTGQADDSVRDVRTRVALAMGPDGWEIRSAGRQVRCQPGRGHTGWSADVCA